MCAAVSQKQQRLAAVIRQAGDTICVGDAVTALGLDRRQAAKLLAGWHNQGNLRRVAHGLYVPVGPTALGRSQVLDDPWILVPELYAPGYVGGWSALEHWGLTEQLFRSVCVLTAKRTACGEVHHQGVAFFVSRIPEARMFGTKTVWRGGIKVQVAGPHKTLLDILDKPEVGAGLQHVMDVLATYAREYSSRQDHERLIGYADRIGNGALFKKLGYVAERSGFPGWFIDECRERLTKGYAYLGSKHADNRLVTRWRLWVPK